MNKKLLKKIIEIPNPIGIEKLMRGFLFKYLKEIRAYPKVDKYGNVFNISNNTPILSAHMDSYCGVFDSFYLKNAIITSYDISGIESIGVDDKIGIYIALRILTENPEVSFIFSTEEECGAIGISKFIKVNHKKLEQNPFCIVLDRGRKSDILCTQNKYGSKEFELDLWKIGIPFNYEPNRGTFCDADKLSKYVSCCNLSVGYYNAHRNDDFAILSEINNAENYVKEILKKLNKRYEIYNYKLDDPYYYKKQKNTKKDYNYSAFYNEEEKTIEMKHAFHSEKGSMYSFDTFYDEEDYDEMEKEENRWFGTEEDEEYLVSNNKAKGILALFPPLKEK